jgi:hypothetical protein
VAVHGLGREDVLNERDQDILDRVALPGVESRTSAWQPRSHPLCREASRLRACSGQRISGSCELAAIPEEGLLRRSSGHD